MQKCCGSDKKEIGKFTVKKFSRRDVKTKDGFFQFFNGNDKFFNGNDKTVEVTICFAKSE